MDQVSQTKIQSPDKHILTIGSVNWGTSFLNTMIRLEIPEDESPPDRDELGPSEVDDRETGSKS